MKIKTINKDKFFRILYNKDKVKFSNSDWALLYNEFVYIRINNIFYRYEPLTFYKSKHFINVQDGFKRDVLFELMRNMPLVELAKDDEYYSCVDHYLLEDVVNHYVDLRLKDERC